MGVRLRETTPDTRMATPIVTANSWSRRPRIPLIKSTGMKTAAKDSVIETMVKPISRAPLKAASIGCSPTSMWRTMFSSITMASSTTKPTESVSAISDRLSSEYPSRYITANVPTIDMGKAMLGMAVADRLRRNRKITRMTSTSARNNVNLTESRMETERS